MEREGNREGWGRWRGRGKRIKKRRWTGRWRGISEVEGEVEKWRKGRKGKNKVKM